MKDVRNYCLVTAAYWAFTLTDGALRMLVLLHFYKLGYSPIQIAFLFLFYEFFGIVTNLLGGWIGSRLGLNFTLWGGLGLQVLALGMLALLSPVWTEAFSVAYVMTAQALSGIAKDLTKMSSKSAIKLLVPEDASGTLFKWVSLLTGSKNALKGVGFFLGGLLLAVMGFVPALLTMAGALLVILVATMMSLSWGIGKAKAKVKFTQIFSKSPEINVLSAARFFLFGARDVWFVVGLPIFLQVTLGWGFTEVGGLPRPVGDRLRDCAVHCPRPSPTPLEGTGSPRQRSAGVGDHLGDGHGGDCHRPSGGPLAHVRHHRRLDVVRRGLRNQLGGPLLSNLGLHGGRQSGPQRRLLLHGERGRAARWHDPVGAAVPSVRAGRLLVGLDRFRTGGGAARMVVAS
mgnify:CR=1 FL=1